MLVITADGPQSDRKTFTFVKTKQTDHFGRVTYMGSEIDSRKIKGIIPNADILEPEQRFFETAEKAPLCLWWDHEVICGRGQIGEGEMAAVYGLSDRTLTVG